MLTMGDHGVLPFCWLEPIAADTGAIELPVGRAANNCTSYLDAISHKSEINLITRRVTPACFVKLLDLQIRAYFV